MCSDKHLTYAITDAQIQMAIDKHIAPSVILSSIRHDTLKAVVQSLQQHKDALHSVEDCINFLQSISATASTM